MVKPSLFCLDLRLMLKLLKDCSANACGTHADSYINIPYHLYTYIEIVRPPYQPTQSDGALGRCTKYQNSSTKIHTKPMRPLVKIQEHGAT